MADHLIYSTDAGVCMVYITEPCLSATISFFQCCAQHLTPWNKLNTHAYIAHASVAHVIPGMRICVRSRSLCDFCKDDDRI